MKKKQKQSVGMSVHQAARRGILFLFLEGEGVLRTRKYSLKKGQRPKLYYCLLIYHNLKGKT